MGVTAQTFNYMNRWLKDSHKSICELGDQQFSCCPPFPELSYTKTYFKNKGLEYDSIDLNGYGQSLMLDLNEDIDHNKQYDFVTDFGTMEHIEDFYMGWKNMDKLCKISGIMIHVIPALNRWDNHGSWRAPMKFFIKLGKAQKYKIWDLHTESTAISPGHPPNDQVYLVYEKTKEMEFIDRETFDSFGPVLAYPIEKYEVGKLGGGRTF